MATFYLDFEGGNDANDGTTFANRWKTITSGATAARIAPGDTIRIMGSPDPSLVGNATWTQYSKDVVLAAAVTATITDCETAWTPVTNATASTVTTPSKQGVRSSLLSFLTAFTTGKSAYFATGTLDLSAYQQVSFWIQNSVAVPSGAFTLRLCSDTVGDVPVYTLPVPAIPSTGQWVPVTVDLGAAMTTPIASISLYAVVDPGSVNIYLDNIIACKASSAADSLTLTSLIGKVCNLSWTAATVYATSDERKPTQPNRNGFRYKATTGGTTDSTEPTWPQEIGVTVTDGTVVWTCTGLEDTWYGIQSINGTTVKLDSHTNTAGNSGRGYSGATETVATYKRETIKSAMVAGSTTTVQSFQDSGTDGALITYTGGWGRIDMSAQTGETWLDGQNGYGIALNSNSKTFTAISNLNTVRFNNGVSAEGTAGWVFRNVHHNNTTNAGFDNSNGGTAGQNAFYGVVSQNSQTYGMYNNRTIRQMVAASFGSTQYGIINVQPSAYIAYGKDIHLRNSSSYGYITNTTCFGIPRLLNLITANNSSGAMSLSGSDCLLFNASISESTAFALTSTNDNYVYSQKHNQTADNHLITTDGGSIVSAIDQRHSPTGIAWKFRPTSTNRNSFYPLKLSVAKIACTANSTVSVAIWCRRDNTNIKGQLFLAGGQLTGVGKDLAIDCQPTVNSWEISSTLTFTPTESGVVEIQFRVWDGVGTANNFWIDDLSVSATA